MKKDYWIKDAINPKNRGLLHKLLKVSKDKKIPKVKLMRAAKGNSPTAKRARLALTLRKFRKKG